MIPSRAAGARTPGRKPRASGDDPHALTRGLGGRLVNPARAGMIRSGSVSATTMADIKQDCIPELCQVEVAGSVV